MTVSRLIAFSASVAAVCLFAIISQLAPGYTVAVRAAGAGLAPSMTRPDPSEALMLVSCRSKVRSHCADVRRDCRESRRTTRECDIRWEDCLATSRCLHGSGPRVWPCCFSLPKYGSKDTCPEWIFARSGRPGCSSRVALDWGICRCVVRGSGSRPGTIEVVPPRK
jgi:hypothetical protein